MKKLIASAVMLGALTFSAIPAFSGTAHAATGCSGTASQSDVICGPYSDSGITASNGYNTYDETDCWAHPGCGYTLTAPDPSTSDSATPWSVTANEPAGNTGVLSYPDEQQLLTTTQNTSPALSAFSKIRSTFSESMPDASTGTDAEAGYDLWGSWGEIMIWVDNVNRGTGGATIDATATFDGQEFTLMNYGSELIWQLGAPGAFQSETSGTVHIKAMIHWLTQHGYTAKKPDIGQVDFGWEICSTGGSPQTFTMNSYTLETPAK